LFFVVWSAGAAHAQTVTVDDLEARTFLSPSGQSLPYRLFVPEGYDPAARYPLILFLHGIGERGDDNRAQLSVWPAPLRFVQPDVQAAHPSFFVAPQAPVDDLWTDIPHFNGPYDSSGIAITRSLQSVIHLLDSLQSAYSIDAARLYVTGLSLGGYGTWDIVHRQPGRFAAGVPIAGGGDPATAAGMTDTAFWAFHAVNDGAVHVSGSREMVAALQAAGAAPLYTEYPSGGHFIWDQAYATPGLPDWLFAQRLAAAAVPEPGAAAALGGMVFAALVVWRKGWSRARRNP
jgi:predicted peptidase